MANQWLRLWHDMPTDPKWRTIAKASGQRIGDVMAVYVHLLVCASNATERGRTQSFNCEDVASALDLDTEQVQAIVDAMQNRVLDGDTVAGWEKRQVAREDGAAERAKAWREAQKCVNERTPNAGERKRTPDKDTDKDKKKKEIAPPEGVSLKTWGDWLQLRRSKRAPVTDTVISGAREEAAKAGMTLEAFLRVWCTRGSQGLQAEWLTSGGKASPTSTVPGRQERDPALVKLDVDAIRAVPIPDNIRAAMGGILKGAH